ncbi:MAG TPA: cupin domain-containing protein [Casimicrobiaceae bacterium]|nr:cupin domain-containing protein [Casimicrobiaceae bacterium]
METAKARIACVVHGSPSYRSAQGSLYTPAISSETVGAQSLFFGIVTIPAGERTRAHVHEFHESAFYVLSGESIELWSGDELQHRELARAGDYLYIPANVPHVAVNRGTQDAVFVGARNEASAQESVVMRPELDRRVP